MTSSIIHDAIGPFSDFMLGFAFALYLILAVCLLGACIEAARSGELCAHAQLREFGALGLCSVIGWTSWAIVSATT